MTKINKKLLLVILIAFILRFYQLGDTPASLNGDEAALGYNAYSISETGRDEHGVFLPLQYFASFGDYKPPVYIYSAVPFVKIFGLTNFAVRLPSAIFGVLTVLLTYLLVKELFTKDETEEKLKIGKINLDFPTIAALSLAVSPWHVQISRAAFESNVALFWVVLGIFLFIKAVNSNPKYIILSFVSLVVSLYTFNSPRLFVPLLFIAIFILFFREIIKNWKWFLIASVLSGILLLPLLPHILSKEGKLRFQEVTIFTDSSIVETANNRTIVDNNTFSSKIIHNRRLGYTIDFLSHYFDHFNPKFLFLSGDTNPKFSLQDVGELYLVDLPLFLAGLYLIAKRRDKKKLFLICYFLLASVPAATARETPHALRSLLILPLYQIIIAYGLVFLMNKAKEKTLNFRKYKGNLGNFVVIFLAILFLSEFVYYQHNYFAHYKNNYSFDWQYGYKEMIPFVDSIKDKYDRVYVSPVYGRPYIFFLYYLKTDPKRFWNNRNNVSIDSFGFYHVDAYEKYNFNVSSREKNTNALYVTPPGETMVGAKIIKEIKFLNNETAFYIWE